MSPARMASAAGDPALLDVSAASAALAAGTLSPVALLEALLDRIRRHEPKLNAYVAVYETQARLAAEAAERVIRAGHAAGPLAGVPIALKDLIEIEGLPVGGGSAIFRERRGARTATIVRRMLAQGMVVLGKTHTVEFAYGGWGTNQHLGTPWNPWDVATQHTPGGSSSGSGVAVAARMAPWAIGTDTGGSVRLPASFCGLTALKCTIGRVSTHGVLPLSSTLDTPGPMTRSVRDAALLYNVIQGPDALDRNTRGGRVDDPLPGMLLGVRGMRLGRMAGHEGDGVDAEVLAAYEGSLRTLERLGAEIVEVTLPRRLIEYANAAAITQAEAYAAYGELAADPSTKMGDATRKRLLSGASLSAREYLAMLRLRDGMVEEAAPVLAGIDALLTPTTATAAIPLAKVDEEVLPSRFTRVVNLLELCALSLPNGFTGAGLPTSLQIICRGWEEATALRIGQAFQSATDFHARVPSGMA